MNMKSTLKRVFGEDRLSAAKGQVCHYAALTARTIHRKSSFQYDKREVIPCYTFTERHFHIFRGYYDIDYFNCSKDRFLCHRIPRKAKAGRDQCEVGYYDLNTGCYKRLGETDAWCWQQGARLRWFPVDDSKVIYNVLKEGGSGYAARICEVEKGACIKELPMALYDLAPDGTYGISLNFARLQNLRPGYGYSCCPDSTTEEAHPWDDGVFYVDLHTGETKLLYSLQQLADMAGPDEETQDFSSTEARGREPLKETVHYINHISIAPDGKHFLFFHLMTKNNPRNWKTRLYVSDSEGKNLCLLEKDDRVSHYTWTDSDTIMATLRRQDGTEYYALYHISDGSKCMIANRGLDTDGHPSSLKSKGLFITDTYPQKGGFQFLRIFNLGGKGSRQIARFYHDYRLRGEKRCDLHPSVDESGEYISIDTTCFGNRRSVMIFCRNR